MRNSPPDTDSDFPVPRHRRTQIERKEESEKRLIEAAMRIVAERGVERMTLAGVGELAGYSRGLATHHFGSKRGLLRTLVNSVGIAFREQMRVGTEHPSGVAALFGMISLYFTSIKEMPTSARAFLVLMTDSSLAGSELGDSIAMFNRESISFIEGHLQAAQIKCEIAADVPIKSTAVLILGILRGVILHRLVDRDSFDTQAVHTQAVEAIRRLIEERK